MFILITIITRLLAPPFTFSFFYKLDANYCTYVIADSLCHSPTRCSYLECNARCCHCIQWNISPAQSKKAAAKAEQDALEAAIKAAEDATAMAIDEAATFHVSVDILGIESSVPK